MPLFLRASGLCGRRRVDRDGKLAFRLEFWAEDREFLSSLDMEAARGSIDLGDSSACDWISNSEIEEFRESSGAFLLLGARSPRDISSVSITCLTERSRGIDELKRVFDASRQSSCWLTLAVQDVVTVLTDSLSAA